MRTIFSIILASTFLLNSIEANIPWSTKEAEVMEKAKQTSLPVLIFFTGGNWCTWCVKLDKEVLEKPEFSKAVEGKFLFLKADFPNGSDAAINASPYKKLMDKYGVDGFPTLVIVDPNGKKIFEMGYQPGGPQKYADSLLTKYKLSTGK